MENDNQSTGRWYSAHATRKGGPGSTQFVVVFEDITERKRREANLTFLAEVDQDLLRLTDTDQSMNMVCEKSRVRLCVSAFA